MPETVVTVEGLGKCYRIGSIKDNNPTLRDALGGLAAAPLRRLKHRGASTGGRTELMWALRDVSFDVQAGDRVGIIGRNGAGKSTLLKVLTRITHPTEGRAELVGSVGSLLEVGTGFHPELTGRDNIYMNGAIIGMRRAEVREKFDDIVAFSEIGRYLDTPVKRYSSGMYVRLAFAVAAHLEPDILIVDEVLAVGDIEFQKKCLGRMGDVASEGRTVLFVSHNMGAISTLCSRAVLLDAGRVVASGPTSDVVGEYITRGLDVSGSVLWSDPDEAPGGEQVKLHAVRVTQRDESTADIDIDEEMQIEIWFWNFEEGNQLSAAVHLHDKSGVTVFAANSSPSAALADDGWSCRPHPVGLYRAVCTVPGNFLNDGMYRVSAWVLKDGSRPQVRADEVVSFTVHDTGAMRQEYTGPWIGAIRPRLAWETDRMEDELTAPAPGDGA
ncbi:MAG TPA: ABC transporter ATP-binding protein [Thermoleophilia bacterium]|nr:ABC transporter ATP-binding protein [Thermoleophilia bacterium]